MTNAFVRCPRFECGFETFFFPTEQKKKHGRNEHFVEGITKRFVRKFIFRFMRFYVVNFAPQLNV